MTTYCPKGHQIRYSGIKPATCPTCQTSLSTPSVAAIVADASIAAAPATRPVAQSPSGWQTTARPARSRANAHSFQVQQTLGSDDDMTFDSAAIRVEREEIDVMTVKDLAARTESIERTEDNGRAPEGVERVSTASLVADMLKASDGQVATASARPRVARAKSTTAKQAAPRRARAAKVAQSNPPQA